MSAETLIHPSAVVEQGAQLGVGVRIEPLSYIGKDVQIGDNTQICNSVSINGNTSIGADCHIYPMAALGNAPQDRKYKGEPTRLSIGDRNIIRELTTIHRGTVQGNGETRVGNDCFILNGCHIAHDCTVGDNTTLIGTTALAGHAKVGKHCTIAAHTLIYQLISIGDYTMTSADSYVEKSIPPFCVRMVSRTGKQRIVYKTNLVALERGGVSRDDVGIIQQALKIFFDLSHSKEQALQEIEQKWPENPYTQYFVDFLLKNPNAERRVPLKA